MLRGRAARTTMERLQLIGRHSQRYERERESAEHRPCQTRDVRLLDRTNALVEPPVLGKPISG